MAPTTSSAKTARGVAIGIVIVLLFLLIGGGSWALLHRKPQRATDPREQALRFFAAAKAQDWNTIYDLTEGISAAFSSPDAYASKMKEAMQQPFFALFYTGMFLKPQITVGDPVISGEEATVAVTRTGEMAGQAFSHTTDLKMKRIDGIWKVADDPQGYGGFLAGNFSASGEVSAGSGGWKVIQHGGSTDQSQEWQAAGGQNGATSSAGNNPANTAPANPANTENNANRTLPQTGDATQIGSPPDTRSMEGAGTPAQSSGNGVGATGSPVDSSNGTGTSPPSQQSSPSDTGGAGNPPNTAGSGNASGSSGPG